jgi:nucleoside-diphosphate-sugar epimerase
MRSTPIMRADGNGEDMAKVAIVGANGQVGAELCLLLGAIPTIELVPVCRYRSGSAFLRWKGIACRHGRITDPREALSLIGDCDVIINAALARGSPREMRRTEDTIAESIFQHSRPGAVVIHLSTQSVYGDPAPSRLIRWRSPYGRAKLATERRIKRCAWRSGKRAFIFRLGHVCGPLQQISLGIQEEILSGEVVLPVGDVASNTVYTVTIRDAILAVINRNVVADTYDLMNKPQWTWRQVYEFEASIYRRTVTFEQAQSSPKLSIGRTVALEIRKAVAAIAQNTWLRELAASMIGYVPERASRRAQAAWYTMRASSQIALLLSVRHAAPHLSWVANGVKFMPDLPTTLSTMASEPYRALAGKEVGVWPDDLPAAR